MNQLILLMSFIVLSGLISCGKETKKTDLQFDEGPISDRKVTFIDLKQKILIPHCIKCHSEFLNEKGIKRVLYPQHPELSHFYLHMKDGSMPTDGQPISGADLELAKAYIEQLPEGLPGSHNADDYFPELPLPPGGSRSRGREYP